MIILVEILLEDNDRQYEFVEYEESQEMQNDMVADFREDPFETGNMDMELDPYRMVDEDELGSLNLDDQMRQGEQQVQDMFHDEGYGGENGQIAQEEYDRVMDENQMYE